MPLRLSNDLPGASAGTISPHDAPGEALVTDLLPTGDEGPHHKPYIVAADESLPSIAERLGHPGEWQALQALNIENPGLNDPHVLPNGLELAVPSGWVTAVLQAALRGAIHGALIQASDPDAFRAYAGELEDALLRTPPPKPQEEGGEDDALAGKQNPPPPTLIGGDATTPPIAPPTWAAALPLSEFTSPGGVSADQLHADDWGAPPDSVDQVDAPPASPTPTDLADPAPPADELLAPPIE